MADFAALLKKKGVTPTFITYSTFKQESEDASGKEVVSWGDSFDFA